MIPHLKVTAGSNDVNYVNDIIQHFIGRGVAYVAVYAAVMMPIMWTLGYAYLDRGTIPVLITVIIALASVNTSKKEYKSVEVEQEPENKVELEDLTAIRMVPLDDIPNEGDTKTASVADEVKIDIRKSSPQIKLRLSRSASQVPTLPAITPTLSASREQPAIIPPKPTLFIRIKTKFLSVVQVSIIHMLYHLRSF